MQPTKALRSLSLGGALFSAALASANFIDNGSFEGAGLPGWTNWGSEFSFMNVYSETGSNGFIPPSAYGNFTGVNAASGDQFVAGLNGGLISQALSVPLTAGETYTLSASLHQALRSDLNHPSTYEVYLSETSTNFTGAVSLGVFAPTASFDEGWVARSFDFTAPTASSLLKTLSFVPVVVPGQGNSYAGLDDVSLQPVPEPGTLLAVSAASLLFGSRLRRKKN